MNIHDHTPKWLLHTAKSIFHGNHLSFAFIDLSDLTEDDRIPEVFLSCLTASEREKFDSFPLMKRKREWLGGRVSAKLAVMQFSDHLRHLQLHTIQISNDQKGRPFCTTSCNPDSLVPDISISHAGNFACSLAADAYCGIDIQDQKETLLHVVDRYCTTGEEALLQSALPPLSRLNMLSLLWSAKESIRKVSSDGEIPGFLALQLISIEPVSDGYVFALSSNGKQFTVLCTFFKKHALAVCLT